MASWDLGKVAERVVIALITGAVTLAVSTAAGRAMTHNWLLLLYGFGAGVVFGVFTFWPAFQARKRVWLGQPRIWIECAYIQVKAAMPQALSATVNLGVPIPIGTEARDFVIGFLPFGPGVKSVWTSDVGFNGDVRLEGRTIKVYFGVGSTAEVNAIGEEVRANRLVEVAVKWKGNTPLYNNLRFEGVP